MLRLEFSIDGRWMPERELRSCGSDPVTAPPLLDVTRPSHAVEIRGRVLMRGGNRCTTRTDREELGSSYPRRLLLSGAPEIFEKPSTREALLTSTFTSLHSFLCFTNG